jgi:hypothetical protein
MSLGDNQFPYKLYGAQQDNTTLIVSSQADPTQLDWRIGPDVKQVPSCPTLRIQISSMVLVRASMES